MGLGRLKLLIWFNMKIELIEDFGLQSLQEKINEFSKGKEIESVSVSVSPMCDFYENRPQEVCNQWHQYVAAIIYKS